MNTVTSLRMAATGAQGDAGHLRMHATPSLFELVLLLEHPRQVSSDEVRTRTGSSEKPGSGFAISKFTVLDLYAVLAGTETRTRAQVRAPSLTPLLLR